MFSTAGLAVDLPVFDNTGTVPTSDVSPGEDKWSFDAFQKAWQAGNHDTGGYNGFLGYWLVDEPLSLDGYIGEYRANGGGPVSSFFGIQPFKIQNALVKTFMSFMLLIFTGAAILSGLNKVATGGGDFNYIHLAIKFMIGVLVIFHPDFIYAAGRTAQTGALYAIHGAVDAVNLKNVLSKGSIDAGVPVNLTNEGITAKRQKIVTRVPKGSVDKVTPVITSYNTAASAAGLPSVDVPTDDASADEALASAWVNFNEIVGTDSAFQSSLKPLQAKFITDMATTLPKDQTALQNKFLKDVGDLTETTAQRIYSIPAPSKLGAAAGAAADFVMGGIAKVTHSFGDMLNAGGKWVSTLIGSILIPVAAWIVLRVCAFVLEMTVIIIVFTYPLWFLDSTKKAFLGAWNGMVGTALIPSVLIILLTVFEGVMATIYSVILGMTPVLLFKGWFMSAQVAYLCMWLAGLIALCWKAPKITKAIMEGGSVVGQMMSAMMVSGLAGAMAGVGVSGTLAGLKSGQPGSMLDDGSGTPNALGNGESNQQSLPSRAGNALPSPAAPGSGGPAGIPLVPEMVGRGDLNQQQREKRANNVDAQLQDKEAKKNAGMVGEIAGTVAGSASGIPGGGMVGGVIGEKVAKHAAKTGALPQGATGGKEEVANQPGQPGTRGGVVPSTGTGDGPASLGGGRRFVKSNPLGGSGSLVQRIVGSGGQKVQGPDGKSVLVSGGTGAKGWAQSFGNNTRAMSSGAGVPVWKAAMSAVKNTTMAAVVSGGDPARLAEAAAAYKLREALGKMANPVLPVQKANRIL